MTTETSHADRRFRPAAIVKAAAPLAAENVRGMRNLLVDQVRSNNRRLLTSLEQVLASPDPANATRACAQYVTQSAQASASNVFDWNRLLLQACRKAMTSVLEAAPAVAETADA